jgi:DNA-binding beta-propeller fold protein YncE
MDVVVRGEKVYIADPGLGAVLWVDLTSRTWGAIETGGDGQPLYPTHLAASDTSLFVSDAKAACIVVYDHLGRFQATWGKGQFKRPAGLSWCQANNRLYAADVGGHCLVILDDKGGLIGRTGERGNGPGQFNFPLWVRSDPRLGLLVTDSLNARVQKFDLSGKFVASLGERGDAAGTLSLPKGLANDRHGHIYLVDSNFENVQIFDPTWQLLLSFGSEGSQLGQFWLPEGIFVDDRDRLWIADSYNRRIQVFEYLHVEEATP